MSLPDWNRALGLLVLAAPFLTVAMNDHAVSESVIAKVRDRLLSGKRSFIRLDVEEVRARGW